MKIAVIGRTQLLYDTAVLFAQKGHSIVLVATAKPAPEYTVGPQGFARLAQEHGALFLQGTKLAAHADAIRAAGADLAISMNWPAILGPEVIGLFPHGILNAHPGDLPRYRGNACPNWAILNGEKEVVLTIHQMDAGELDSGPVLLKDRVPLTGETTIGQVYQKLEAMMPDLYLQAAEGLLDGSIPLQPQSQDPADILRVYPRLPRDSLIDWRCDAVSIARLVRASSEPFSGAYTYYNGVRLTVFAARSGRFAVPSQAAPGQVTAIDRDTGEVSVAAGDGFVALGRVVYNGKEYARPAEVIPSMRARLGMVAEDELAALRAEVAELRARLEHLTEGAEEE